MTQIEVDGGTGQHRIQLWREALGLLREYPLLGVGQGMMPEYTRLVAHNSYVHAFAELGLIGGSCFVSIVYLVISQLSRLKKVQDSIADPEMRRLRPYLLGIVCGFFAGVTFLSRVYVVPTYMVVGLAAAYLYHVRLKDGRQSPLPRLDASLFLRLSAISLTALVALEVGSRLMVRWEG
jgi:O-antigen ligase